MSLFIIIDEVSGNPVFNVMADNGHDALMKFMSVRGLRADYELCQIDDTWTLTNKEGHLPG